MILRSTDTAPESPHLVWLALRLGTARIWRFQNGYARHAYANGRHGIERVTWCLRDVEDIQSYNRGELHARVWRMKLDSIGVTCARIRAKATSVKSFLRVRAKFFFANVQSLCQTPCPPW